MRAFAPTTDSFGIALPLSPFGEAWRRRLAAFDELLRSEGLLADRQPYEPDVPDLTMLQQVRGAYVDELIPHGWVPFHAGAVECPGGSENIGAELVDDFVQGWLAGFHDLARNAVCIDDVGTEAGENVRSGAFAAANAAGEADCKRHVSCSCPRT